MPLKLRWKGVTTEPVEGDILRPDGLVPVRPLEFARQPILVGSGSAEVGELFHVTDAAGEPDEETLDLEGDLRQVRGIGRGLCRGSIRVQGDAGAYLGSGMTGGLVEVSGNVAAWAGAEMRGGLIQIRGNAGRFLGASLPGSRLGMNDGIILVDGSAGDDVGRRMRRGLIAVCGPVGDFFGRELIAGSVLAFGSAGRFAGMGMKRGTVGLFGPGRAEVFPTFASAGKYRFPFLTTYFLRLHDLGFPVPAAVFSAELERYNGDLARGGQGEILVGPR